MMYKCLHLFYLADRAEPRIWKIDARDPGVRVVNHIVDIIPILCCLFFLLISYVKR